MSESQHILSLETTRKQVVLALVLTVFNFLAIAFINHGFNHTAMLMEKAVLVEVLFIFTHFFLLIKLMFFIEKYFDRKFAEKSDSLVRYALELLYFLAACGILFTIVFLLPVSTIQYVAYRNHFMQIPGTVVREFYIIDMVFAFILYASKVGLVTYARLQEVALEADRLEQENAHEVFETLKNNINPTFLFGSLHTLSELIYQDKDKASELVNELSDVYRYVLDNKDKELVSLEKELAYLHQYADLLNAQHPGLLHIKIAVDEAFKNHLIPPMLLQVMIDQIISQFSDEQQAPFTLTLQTDATGHLMMDCPHLPEKESIHLDKFPLLDKLIHKYKHLTSVRLLRHPEKGTYRIQLRLLEAV